MGLTAGVRALMHGSRSTRYEGAEQRRGRTGRSRSGLRRHLACHARGAYTLAVPPSINRAKVDASGTSSGTAPRRAAGLA